MDATTCCRNCCSRGCPSLGLQCFLAGLRFDKMFSGHPGPGEWRTRSRSASWILWCAVVERQMERSYRRVALSVESNLEGFASVCKTIATHSTNSNVFNNATKGCHHTENFINFRDAKATMQLVMSLPNTALYRVWGAWIQVHPYICVCVCVHIYAYACLFVCMSVRVHVTDTPIVSACIFVRYYSKDNRLT